MAAALVGSLPLVILYAVFVEYYVFCSLAPPGPITRLRRA